MPCHGTFPRVPWHWRSQHVECLWKTPHLCWGGTGAMKWWLSCLDYVQELMKQVMCAHLFVLQASSSHLLHLPSGQKFVKQTFRSLQDGSMLQFLETFLQTSFSRLIPQPCRGLPCPSNFSSCPPSAPLKLWVKLNSFSVTEKRLQPRFFSRLTCLFHIL